MLPKIHPFVKNADNVNAAVDEPIEQEMGPG